MSGRGGRGQHAPPSRPICQQVAHQHCVCEKTVVRATHVVCGTEHDGRARTPHCTRSCLVAQPIFTHTCPQRVVSASFGRLGVDSNVHQCEPALHYHCRDLLGQVGSEQLGMCEVCVCVFLVSRLASHHDCPCRLAQQGGLVVRTRPARAALNVLAGPALRHPGQGLRGGSARWCTPTGCTPHCCTGCCVCVCLPWTVSSLTAIPWPRLAPSLVVWSLSVALCGLSRHTHAPPPRLLCELLASSPARNLDDEAGLQWRGVLCLRLVHVRCVHVTSHIA